MSASDLTPLVTRLREVLTESPAGLTRPVDQSVCGFRWSPGRVAPRDMPPSGAPSLTVEIVSMENAAGTPGNETADWWLIDVALVVWVSYHAAGGDYLPMPDGGEIHSLASRFARDALVIRGVLNHPENLATTEAGADTGLVSGLLQWVRSESIDAEPLRLGRHEFRGQVEITPP